jgi:hypothetical protein
MSDELKQDILIANGFIAVPSEPMTLADLNEMDAKYPGWDQEIHPTDASSLATVLQNLAYYGYTVDANALRALSELDKDDLAAWFKKVKPVLADLTKDNRQMDKHVVYKNFPREVLQMDEGEYVLRQMLIYHGFPYGMVAEEGEPRAPLGDMQRLKVLAMANEATGDRIFQNLVSLNNRWNENQTVWAEKLIGQKNLIDIDDFGFKENGIALMAKFFETKEIHLDTGTDALRLASALSGQDISLREKVRFKKFSRPERKKLLSVMEQSNNLGDDFATRPEQFKRLLERLRPGDYANEFPNTVAAHDGLYNRTVKPFSALVDPQEIVPETLEIVATRPGEFLRRFHHFYDLFGDEAVDKMVGVMDKLNTRQLVNFRAYLRSINQRQTMMYPPKANWARAKVMPKKKGYIADWSLRKLDDRIGEILKGRLSEAFPEGVLLDTRVDQVKLQTNDQKLAEYGRGTVFPIPDEVTFIRSASYWQIKGWAWFDNGWNFFDDNWKPLGTLAWNQANFQRGAALFSGDPYGGKTTDNRACQMIDLYPEKLRAAGVRYAVWNVLCYSRIKFSDCDGEVLSALQLGEGSPQKGKLFEPARATMVFPLRSEHYSSYIVYVDLQERKIVYMDAPLKANVSSAVCNEGTLSELMPAYVEYLNSLPSVHDLMRDAPLGAMPVVYSDRDLVLDELTAKRAFVFRPENPKNTLDRVTVAELAKVG